MYKQNMNCAYKLLYFIAGENAATEMKRKEKTAK